MKNLISFFQTAPDATLIASGGFPICIVVQESPATDKWIEENEKKLQNADILCAAPESDLHSFYFSARKVLDQVKKHKKVHLHSFQRKLLTEHSHVSVDGLNTAIASLFFARAA